MTIRMDSLIKTIASALDYVEQDLLGISTNHGKRIAVLCAKMGKALGKSQEEAASLAHCALLHDNALTEYILAERKGLVHDPMIKNHCECGQRNVDSLGFNTDIKDFILYHHERADGKGCFGIHEGEGPVEAELIAIADSIDLAFHLQTVNSEKLGVIRRTIADESGKRFSKTASQTLLEILDESVLLSLRCDVIRKTVEESFIPWIVDIEDRRLIDLAGFITKIIDYKSIFTQRHSTQIANKAWFMSGYFKYNNEERIKLYLAAALHDIGKLKIPAEILEKPGKLNDEEYLIIKDHVRQTWELLKDIDGFQSICSWASNHHERLDGKGYPFGKSAKGMDCGAAGIDCDAVDSLSGAEELDFNSRLMACIDVYQAVSEERPYHPARNHEDTMKVLYEIAGSGAIDKNILNEMSLALAPFKGKDLPPPQM